jgi:hypothetical protein
MERNNEGAGAAAAELPAPTEIAGDLTLFQIEESVALLAESAEEEGLTPEIERALAAYLEGALEKRDRVAQFIHYCDGMAELAKAEIKRLQARQKHFEATSERVQTMVLHVLDFLGVKKLEGRTHTLVKRKCPASVKIADEAAIPPEFKRLTLPLDQWHRLLAAVPEELRKEAMTAAQKQEESINLVAVKEALNLERQVPGADLLVNQYILQLR